MSMRLSSRRCVASVVFLPFTDDEQMKELHPRLLYHAEDWLAHHLIVTHCQAKHRSFAHYGEDPDLAVHRLYMKRLKRQKRMAAQQSLKRRRVDPFKRSTLPAPKVSFPILRFQRLTLLSFRRHIDRRNRYLWLAPTRGLPRRPIGTLMWTTFIGCPPNPRVKRWIVTSM